MAQTTASRQFATLPQGSTLIHVECLTRIIATRAQQTVILDDVTFTIPAQSLFAVNGPSGSGKSTLLNMLTGIDRATSGRVIFAGQELRARGENALARWPRYRPLCLDCSPAVASDRFSPRECRSTSVPLWCRGRSSW